jgi:UDP-N-acetylmuramate dehydrogenase
MSSTPSPSTSSPSSDPIPGLGPGLDPRSASDSLETSNLKTVASGFEGDENLVAALEWADHALTKQLNGRVERAVALSGLTTFRLGGPARLLLRAQGVDDLEVLADIRARAAEKFDVEIPVVVIGQGSNLLISDAGFEGVAIQLSGDFSEVSISGPSTVYPAFEDRGAQNATSEGPAIALESIVTAGGAVKLPVLARKCAAAGYAGLGWMVGVPGSVGGAVRMNAGGHGSDISANVVSVTLVDISAEAGKRTRTVAKAELGLVYRSSVVLPHEIVVSASFACTSGSSTELDDELTEIVRWRRANQPGGANCGSVFTNPPGQSAGKLIDDLGLRGFRLHPEATACVSEKHANFIQADPDGRTADVWALIVHVRNAVFSRYGIALHPEVQTLGFDASLPELS